MLSGKGISDNKLTWKMSLLYRLASPFLDMLEEILSFEDQDDQEDEDEEDKMMSSDEEQTNHENMMKCISGEDFLGIDEEEANDKEDVEDVVDSDDDLEVICGDDI